MHNCICFKLHPLHDNVYRKQGFKSAMKVELNQFCKFIIILHINKGRNILCTRFSTKIHGFCCSIAYLFTRFFQHTNSSIFTARFSSGCLRQRTTYVDEKSAEISINLALNYPVSHGQETLNYCRNND